VAVDNTGNDVSEISLGIDAGQLAGLDQRGDGGPMVRTAVGAGKECVLACQSERPDCAFDGVVKGHDAADASVSETGRWPGSGYSPSHRAGASGA